MERHVPVYVDLDGEPHLVGRLWAHVRRDRESATFEYDPSWLEHRSRFSLDPALSLGAGAYHTPAGKALFGALGDSAPDRWGRVLMRRAERRRAARERQTPRTLTEIDYLLMVDDEARQGALRFAAGEGEAFLATSGESRIPPLVDVHRLLTASDRVLAERDSDEDLQLLLAPGSSLGGARPKASVRDRDHLAVAKFPREGDEVDVCLWEAVALTLAGRAGIKVPEWRIERVAERNVLLLRRFDRSGARRIPFLSAMSLLGADDNETRSYLEIADALRQHGASPTEDLRELWRRIVLNVLLSNSDDHLRNHAFLYTHEEGWRLSPAYDLNPVPVDIRPRVLSTAIDLDDTTASFDLAMSVADYFGLSSREAGDIGAKVAGAVAQWRSEAAGLGADKAEIDRMASAFEHDDLKKALS